MKATILVASILTLVAVNACTRKCNDVKPQPLTDWTNKITELYKHNEAKRTITEGIAGTLTYKEGDCMPMVNPATTTCKEFPVKGAVRIYNYLNETDVTRGTDNTITNINGTLVGTAPTDAEGFYQLSLTPGTYSFIMEYNGKLYNFMTVYTNPAGLHPVSIISNTVLYENVRIDKAVY